MLKNGVKYLVGLFFVAEKTGQKCCSFAVEQTDHDFAYISCESVVYGLTEVLKQSVNHRRTFFLHNLYFFDNLLHLYYLFLLLSRSHKLSKLLLLAFRLLFRFSLSLFFTFFLFLFFFFWFFFFILVIIIVDLLLHFFLNAVDDLFLHHNDPILRKKVFLNFGIVTRQQFTSKQWKFIASFFVPIISHNRNQISQLYKLVIWHVLSNTLSSRFELRNERFFL